MRSPREVLGEGVSDALEALLVHVRDALFRCARPEQGGESLRVAVFEASEQTPVGERARVARGTEPAFVRWSEERGGAAGERDAVFFNFSLERSWGSEAESGAALRRAAALLAPHGVVLGLTLDGATAHRRYEAAAPRAEGGELVYGVTDGAGQERLRVAFGRWPESAEELHGRALELRLSPGAEERARRMLVGQPSAAAAWAVDPDELWRQAADAGLVLASDAHGLEPLACWNALEWFAATGEEWPLPEWNADAEAARGEPLPADALAPFDWASAASFAVFALRRGTEEELRGARARAALMLRDRAEQEARFHREQDRRVRARRSA
jgi:hypothetical protein